MPRTKSLSNPDTERAERRIRSLNATCRANVEARIGAIRDHVNGRCEQYGRPYGSFTIGEYLQQQEEQWQLAQSSQYGDFPWSDAIDLLGHRYNCALKRNYLWNCVTIYKHCHPYVAQYPQIMDICNGIRRGTYARKEAIISLKELSEAGDGETLLDWLLSLENDEEEVEQSIWDRRAELAPLGIDLAQRQYPLARGLPKVDLWGTERDAYLAIEVKDRHCDFHAVGQVLSYLSYLHRTQGDVPNARGAIMARAFSKSACYAAFGQRISLIKIDLSRQGLIIDRIEADSMTWQDLDRFLGV